MSRRTVRSLALALAAVGLLSACSGKDGNTTTPTSGSSAPTSSTSGGGSGPKVPAALPTDGLISNPCSALAADQLSGVGLTGAGKPLQAATGPSCRWTSSTFDVNSIDITPVPANKNGISDIYAQKAQDAYFEPTTVGGYPAVSANVSDLRSSGDCPLWVGVTDQLAVVVTAQIGAGPNKTQPCGSAQRVAEAMIQHLKGAA